MLPIKASREGRIGRELNRKDINPIGLVFIKLRFPSNGTLFSCLPPTGNIPAQKAKSTRSAKKNNLVDGKV
jgi:hypothetical protein